MPNAITEMPRDFPDWPMSCIIVGLGITDDDLWYVGIKRWCECLSNSEVLYA